VCGPLLLSLPFRACWFQNESRMKLFHWDANGDYPRGHRDPSPVDRAYVGNNASAWRDYDWSIVTVLGGKARYNL
jgi:hypothetical protein